VSDLSELGADLSVDPEAYPVPEEWGETTDYWDGKTVMVTGGAGFLGGHLVEDLRSRSDSVEVFVPRSDEYDLRERAAVRRAFEDSGADVVIHLAASVGGIGANRENPGRYFYDNATMGIELIEQARQFDVDKVTVLGTICSYPKHTPVPFRESALYEGFPEETNAPYGIAKKALLTQLQAYHAQYDLRSVYLMPVNLYGPGDDFDLETAHVLPALLRKAHEAEGAAPDGSDAPVTLWGSGEPKREFLYIEDLANAVRFVLETPKEEIRDVAPDGMLNVGVSEDLSINELMTLIQDVIGHDGPVEHDRLKPDGTPRKLVDTSRLDALGWEAQTSLREGIERTYDWYCEQIASNVAR